MRNNNGDPEIDDLETRLRNEIHRYDVALKDGALESIIKQIRERINELETQLVEKSRITLSI